MNRFLTSNLTEEELMLQSKYTELKETKQMLQEKLEAKTAKPSSNPVFQASNISVEEAKAAREAAEKLAKSGIIRTQQTSPRQEQGFKKSLGLEKKLGSTEKSSISYQPFSAIENFREDKPASNPNDETSDENSLTFKPLPSTIYIYGNKLSKELLEKHFTQFGKILKIKIEADEKAFITYTTLESAERAIREMHFFDYDTINCFEVSMSRHQPKFDNATMWSPVAANYLRPRQNLKEKENRKATVYDNNNPFK